MQFRAVVISSALLPSLLFAQSSTPPALQKGSMLIGGSASLARQESGGEKQTSLSITPALLKLVADGIAIGGRLGITRVSADGSTSTGWSIGPAARVYVNTQRDGLLPFVAFSVGFGRTESESGPIEITQTQRVLDGSVGVMKLLGAQVGLDAELFYNNSDVTARTDPPLGGPVETQSTTLGVRFGISAFWLQR